MTDWWWIRHGPTHAKSMVGWSDIKADLSDRETIKKLNEYLPKSADLVSSDLSRTIETANVIQHNQNQLLLVCFDLARLPCALTLCTEIFTTPLEIVLIALLLV